MRHAQQAPAVSGPRRRSTQIGERVVDPPIDRAADRQPWRAGGHARGRRSEQPRDRTLLLRLRDHVELPGGVPGEQWSPESVRDSSTITRVPNGRYPAPCPNGIKPGSVPKPVVLRWGGTQPICNPRFLAFAAFAIAALILPQGAEAASEEAALWDSPTRWSGAGSPGSRVIHWRFGVSMDEGALYNHPVLITAQYIMLTEVCAIDRVLVMIVLRCARHGRCTMSGRQPIEGTLL
jgi:hypothetical protein